MSSSQPTPKIIHQTWKSSNIPEHYQAYVQSVKDFNSDFEYKLWTDMDIDEIVKERTPQFYQKYKSFKTHIERVDFARYVILYFFGGVYVDLDVESIKSFSPLVEKNQIVLGVEASEHNWVYGGEVLSNAVMISPPEHPFWMDFMTWIVTNYRPKWYRNAVHTTGPKALADFVKSCWDVDKYNIQILSSCAFMPMSDCYNMNNTIDGHESISNDCKTLEQTYCIHKWSHAWIDIGWKVIPRDKGLLINCAKLILLILFTTIVVCIVYMFNSRFSIVSKTTSSNAFSNFD